MEFRAFLRNELGSVLEVGRFREERCDEIIDALHVREREGREEIVPPEGIVALSTAVESEVSLERLAEHPHARYSLLGGILRESGGIVYYPVPARHRRERESGELSLRVLATPRMSVFTDTTVKDAIDQFQTENQEHAEVVNDGEIVRVVAVAQIPRSVMDDIEDPLDGGELSPD